MKEFCVRLVNRVGALRDVAKVAGDAGVNIRAISSEDHGNEAFLRIVAERETLARDAFKKAGYSFEESQVIQVTMPDEPGELAKYAHRLADGGVDVRAVYLLGKGKNKTELAFSVDKFDRAMKLCYPGEQGAE